MAVLPPDPVYLMRGSMGPVHSLLFRINPYVEHIYAGTEKGKIYIWDLRKKRELLCLEPGDDPVLAMHIFDNENLITQQKCGIINLWKGNGSQWILDQKLVTDVLSFCRCQPYSEEMMLIPYKNSSIGLLSLKSFDVESTLNSVDFFSSDKLGSIMAMKAVPSLNQLLVAYESGLIALWDINNKKILNHMQMESCPMAIEYETSYMRGIVGDASEQLQIFNISKDHVLSSKCNLTLKNPGTAALAIRPNAKVFTAAGWDGRLRIFSWKSLRQLAVLDQHKESLHCVVYSSEEVSTYNNKYLMAAAGKDGYISLWDIYN
ncbi:guanine nucleotide-binding protein subunit beta-like protein 1 [Prorops nasuta]|uniref:guanine nucleotide-binding protein subunit beta-like protein 1 n=1 Tax=Prorops nasuta TaxID=863751 RepID=UPI0034CD355A